MAAPKDDLTPMIKQYLRIKETCGDAILMFRLGDFYEMFEEDAKTASRILDLALTKKHIGGGRTVPLAGVPYHALHSYLFKLTRSGHRVAICEQMEDPKKTKKLVKREVVRTVTPGTLVESEGLEGWENNYLASIHDGGLEGFGLATADISTGEFRATALESRKGSPLQDSGELLSELSKVAPSEVLVIETTTGREPFLDPFLAKSGCAMTKRSAAFFTPEPIRSIEVNSENMESPFNEVEERLAGSAAGALLRYLDETQKGRKNSLLELVLYRPAQFLRLDAITERNLELVRNIRDGGRRGTLISVLDRTCTAMGSRELKGWILRPLQDLDEIGRRQDAIAAYLSNPTVCFELRENLQSIRDIERLLSRIEYRSAGPRDLSALEASLSALPGISARLAQILPSAGTAKDWFQPLNEEKEVRDLVANALVDEPPATSREGGIFREGFHSELDELRNISRGGKDWILDLQNRERKRLDIPSLKVGYNKVFGYYIEVTKTHQEKVPPDYVRKQTLVAAERYITPELKDYENKVLSAQERMAELERSLFGDLVEKVAAEANRIQATARRLAVLDALLSLAVVASENGYSRPVVDRSDRIEIEGGRHPTLEQSDAVERFVPNDVLMDNEENQMILITGPNMGGKSTYIRQVALLTLMAHMGSYLPASKARVGLTDRIFSRVGASDYLFEGHSTFMVEMSETAHILRNVTPKSLVILDEIGRGTATYDGIGLAWAIVEYLLNVGRVGVRTLFATHYHEMAELEKRHERVKNHHALVAEKDGKVTFLYQIAPGASDHSYGIHVAELAGIPKQVTRRASRILSELESGEFHRASDGQPTGEIQLSLFSLVDEPIAELLRNLDPEEMSPMEALRTLDELVRKAKASDRGPV